MKQFKKLLVGVDLSSGDQIVADELSAPNHEAVRQSIWLAKSNGATIRFCYILDVSPQAQHNIESDEHSAIKIQAQAQLDELVALAQQDGVSADTCIGFGNGAIGVIQEVLRSNIDLVVVGTRHLSKVKGMLMGSTSLKLMRKCPCPVWVVQPDPDPCQSILVAHDLRDVGKYALQLGATMAAMQQGKLHVLHSIEVAHVDQSLTNRPDDDSIEQYRTKAEATIQSELAACQFAGDVQVSVVLDRPADAILQYVQQHDIDLLAMGTVGRTGIPGFIIGNTAERLLPQLPCSVLAVKPADFKTPVSVTE
ncbi:MAG: universal stress protein [Pirellulaceae bacterium]